MTIVLQGQDGVIEQARRQLADLVPVWDVLNYTGMPLVQRELLLAKISILGPEYFEEWQAHHQELAISDPMENYEGAGFLEGAGSDAVEAEEASIASREAQGAQVAIQGQAEYSSVHSESQVPPHREKLRRDFHPSKLAVSQALRHKHEHLEAITHLTHQFGGKVLDISTNNCIVELSAKPTRIDSFLKLVAPFGLLESARTGELEFHDHCPMSG